MAATAKTEITRTQSIRDYFKKNPKALAKEVVTALAKDGITVSEGHVYVVKGKLKLTRKRTAKANATASVNGTAKKAKSPTSTESPNKSHAIRALLAENPSSSVSEVISTLAAKGVDVKKGLVYLVKSQMKSMKHRQEKVAAASGSGEAQPKGEVNRSQIIRDFVKENPTKSLAEVVDALAEKGVTVTKNHVYVTKAKMHIKKKRQQRKEKAATAAATTPSAPASNGDVLATIRKIKSLATETGGMKTLKALVDALAE